MVIPSGVRMKTVCVKAQSHHLTITRNHWDPLVLLLCTCYRMFCGSEKGTGDICGVKGWPHGWFWASNTLYKQDAHVIGIFKSYNYVKDTTMQHKMLEDLELDLHTFLCSCSIMGNLPCCTFSHSLKISFACITIFGKTDSSTL